MNGVISRVYGILFISRRIANVFALFPSIPIKHKKN